MPKIILVSRCAWTLYNFRAGLMRELKKRGWTVLGGGAGGDGFEDKVEALGVPFVPLPVDKKGINPIADLKLLWTLYRWYRKERPDIVHHFTIKPVIYGSIAGHLAGVPRIVNMITGLGFVFMGEAKPWLRKLAEWLYRMALKHAHFTFFQNSEDQNLFLERRLLAPEKAGLLPGSGVDLGHFTPGADDRRRNTDKSIRFLMVARLLRDKGVYEYVEAARIVKACHAQVQFQILGARDERNPTVVPESELDRWQNEGVIAWLGEVEDVRPFLNEADVVALPSYREGLPRSLLEAAAMAKPIITTDTVGCRDVVADGVNGLLVPVKDSVALAQAMIRMIENPDMQERMGRAGRVKVEKEFDERLVIEKTLAVYETANL